MSFPAYPSYRESGIDRIGAVPGHWSVLPLKWLLAGNDGGVWGDDPDGDDETLVLRSTEQTVDGRWQIDDPASRKLSATDRERAMLRVGDLLVTKSSGSALHIGKTTLIDAEVAELRACYSNFMQRLRPSGRIEPRLLWYLLNSEIARKQLDLLSNSSTGLANLNGTMLGLLDTPLPPDAEQTAIVAFLDRETAKIDALMDEQRRLIELLKEKRQAVISHAVTKGLDPTVPMKDSGLDWLGQVPEHWTLTSIGRLCKVLSYGFTNPMPTSDDGPFMLTANDIGDGHVRFETARRTTAEAFESLLTDKSRPMAGDVLLTKDGTLGRIAVFDGTPSCINQSVAFMRPKTELISSAYFAAALADGVYQDRMIYEAGGTTIKHIYISRLAKMPLAIPPPREMKKIERFCTAHRFDTQRLTTSAKSATALLSERRAALISAAVTGKIDVRGAVTQQLDAVAA